MHKRSLWSGAVSGAVLLAAAGLVVPAWAESFDTSDIAVSTELAARVPASIREAGVLIAGSDNSYAPWEYLAGEDGQTPEGIDVDLMRALTAKLDLDYEQRTAQFSTILPALGTNYDVGVSAFSITNERMAIVNFVTYVRSGNIWVVKAGNPDGFDPADICGSVLAIQTGTWHEDKVREASAECEGNGQPAIEILPFGMQTEAFTRVAAGGADASISGDATGLYAVKQSNGTLEPLPPTGLLDSSGTVGIAVPKADMELTQLIADTLNEMMQDGTYKAVLDHWGVASMGIEKAEINPVAEY